MSKTQTIQILINALKSEQLTADQAHEILLGAGMDLSKRTVYRYLETLEKMDFGNDSISCLTKDGGKRVWSYTRQSEASINQSVINTLEMLRAFGPSVLEQARSTTLKTLDTLLHKEMGINEADNITNPYSYLWNTGVPSAEAAQAYNDLDQIINSTKNGRKMMIHVIHEGYYNVDSFDPSSLWCPVKVIVHSGMIFLGLVHDQNNKILILGLDQLEAHSHSHDTFDIAEKARLFEASMQHRFGLGPSLIEGNHKIKVEFDEDVNPVFINRNWHRSQKIVDTADGPVLHLNCEINYDLVLWLRQLGPNIRAIEPKELVSLAELSFQSS